MGGGGNYLRTIRRVAYHLRCRPEYLSEAALRRGYEYSRALRWIRFLHGMVLSANDTGVSELVWRLGFNDRAGWDRFVVRLLGKRPVQLARVPLEFWVREAVSDTFMTIRGSRWNRTSDVSPKTTTFHGTPGAGDSGIRDVVTTELRSVSEPRGGARTQRRGRALVEQELQRANVVLSAFASCSSTALTCRSSTPGNHSTNSLTVAPPARFS